MKQSAQRQSGRRWLPRPSEWWRGAGFFIAQLAACGIAQWLAIVPGTGVSLWIPGGLYLAALLLSRSALWPCCMLTAAAAELLGNIWWFRNPWDVALLLHLGNALGAVVGAVLVRWLTGRRLFRLDSLRNVLVLMFVGALLAPALSALVGAAVLHVAQGHSLMHAWLLWWLGDATGTLIGAPIALTAARLRRPGKPRTVVQLIEALLIGCLLLFVSGVSLSGQLPFAYMVTPALVWAAVSFQFSGAAAAMLVLTLMTGYFTVTGRSPFVGTVQTQALHSMMLQLFLAVSAILGLCVAAVSHELRQAVVALRQANAGLEARVLERTRQLQAAGRHKDVLLALIAHEVRTPLSAITTSAHVLQHRQLTEDQLQRVQQVIARQSLQISRLVEDLLDTAAISEGKLTLGDDLVDMADVVSHAVESCQARIDACGHRLEQVRPDAPV